MSFDWKMLNGLASAVFEDGLPLQLTHVNEELRACESGATVLAPLADLSWLLFSGADAKSFLHNQLTSDINHLSIDHWQHSSWCSPKGRMLVSFIAFCSAIETYQLQLATDLAPSMLKRLKMFVLRAKVHIENVDATQLSFGLAGKDAAAILSMSGLPVPLDAHSSIPFADGFVLRLATDRFQVVVSATAALKTWEQLSINARPVGLHAWRWLNIQAGIPLVRQATQEEFVPQMVNFDKINGVSFNKGCYPGQEIVARTQYLGKVKRHLYRVHAQESLQVGSHLFAEFDTQHCGVIAEAAPSPDGGWDALAVMLENAATGTVRCARVDGQPLLSISTVAA